MTELFAIFVFLISSNSFAATKEEMVAFVNKAQGYIKEKGLTSLALSLIRQRTKEDLFKTESFIFLHTPLKGKFCATEEKSH